MTQDPLVHKIAEHLMKRDHRAPCVYDTAQEILQLVQEEGGIGDAIASSDGAHPTSRTGTGANRYEDDTAEATVGSVRDRHREFIAASIVRLGRERRELREALLELHRAGLALAPLVPPIDASVSVRWDEAMGAADDLLHGSVASTERAA